MARDIQGMLENTLAEGKHYFIANFQVFENGGQYKACHQPFRLLFSPSTHVHEEHYDIPQHPYTFLSIADVLQSKEVNFADHLIGWTLISFFGLYTFSIKLDSMF